MTQQNMPPQAGFDLSRIYVWVKGLESKTNNLTREVDLIKHDFMRKYNDLKHEIRSVNDDLLELKHQQDMMLQKMDLIIKELKKTAGVEEVDMLKKYVDLWSPLNFVTQRDLERAIEARIAELKHKK